MEEMVILTTTKPQGLKYFCSGILLFNVVYSLVLFIESSEFSSIVIQYYIVFGLYFLSIISAAVAIYDDRAVLIYPYIITTIPLSIVAFVIFGFQLKDIYFCTSLKNTQLNDDLFGDQDVFYKFMRYVQFYDCSWVSEIGWMNMEPSTVTAIGFLLLAIEKVFEIILFRKLQKCFMKLKAARQMPSLSATRLADILKDLNITDSDDDMVIYDKRNPKIKIHSVQENYNPFENNSNKTNSTEPRIIA